jgi:hypothetical protein
MNPERKLIHDPSIAGAVCNACGWAWPTPRMIPSGRSATEHLQQEFDAHNCKEYPLPLKEQLKRAEVWEQQEHEKNEAIYAEVVEKRLERHSDLPLAQRIKAVLEEGENVKMAETSEERI